jgi:hypothetical protein
MTYPTTHLQRRRSIRCNERLSGLPYLEKYFKSVRSHSCKDEVFRTNHDAQSSKTLPVAEMMLMDELVDIYLQILDLPDESSTKPLGNPLSLEIPFPWETDDQSDYIYPEVSLE